MEKLKLKDDVFSYLQRRSSHCSYGVERGLGFVVVYAYAWLLSSRISSWASRVDENPHPKSKQRRHYTMIDVFL